LLRNWGGCSNSTGEEKKSAEEGKEELGNVRVQEGVGTNEEKNQTIKVGKMGDR